MAPQAERLLDKFEDMERAVECDLRRAHKRLKQSILSYLLESRPLNPLAVPIIYSMIVPIALLEVWMSLYQWICFPLFGIRRVQRRDYIVVDRHELSYLNGIEKLNCVFAAMPTACSATHARSPAAPRRTGVLSSTASAPVTHTRITRISLPTATRLDTSAACGQSAAH